MTNAEVGAKIGKSESYASLLRRNKRVPSTGLFVKIVEVFGLDPGDSLAALVDRRFGTYLEEHALSTPDEDSSPAPVAS